MKDTKRHGRRRAEKPKRHNQTAKNLGTVLLTGSLLATVCSPALAIDDGITSSDRTVAASKSVANVASEFLSATKRNTEPVKADPNVKLTFDMPKVTSTAGVETKKKEELKANEAKDAKAAAYAAEIAAKSSKTDSAAAGSASVNMPKDEKAAVVVTPTEPTELLSHPLKTLIPTSPFGVRVSPITGAVDEFHRGQDYSAACGTDVFATAGGTVIYTQWHPYGGGNRVEIDHGNGLITTYNHLSASKVKVGQKVERGELIALSGTTGASTGCHLHFEVEVNHKVVNPLPWL